MFCDASSNTIYCVTSDTYYYTVFFSAQVTEVLLFSLSLLHCIIRLLRYVRRELY